MRPFACGLALLLTSVLSTPPTASTQTPAEPSAATPQETDATSFSKEAAVIEDMQVKARFENDGTSVYDATVRARIQSEAAVRENGVLAFSYFASNQTLEIKWVRVRKPDGAVVETSPDTVQDLTSEVTRSAPMYTDEREKHVAVRGLSAGDTLEYRTITVTNKPLAPGQFWLAYRFSRGAITLHELLEINVPKDRAVKVLGPNSPPSVTEEGNRRIYAFHSSHLKKDPEPNRWEQALAVVPEPDVQLSSFASWDEVAAWYASLQKRALQVTPGLRAKAEELTRGKTSDTEKINALYDFVSTKFRYVSISLGQGRYAPHGAAEVLANQFGDCKDKHTLFAALLEAEGISAYPALINSTMKSDLEIPYPGIFNHVVTAVPQNGAFLWFDTTTGVAPPRFLSKPLRDKLAMVVTDQDKSLLIKTSADPPFPVFQHFTMTAALDSSGTLDGKARIETRGDAELLLRQVFRDTPQSSWKELAQGYSVASGFGGTVDDVAAGDALDTSAPFWFTYSYHRPEYGDWPNHRITLPFPRVGLPELPKEDAESPARFPLGSKQEISYEVHVTLPEGLWPALNAPVKQTKDFADYASAYEIKDRVIHGTRKLQLLLDEVPNGKRAEYSELYKAVDEDERRWIDLLGASAPPPAVASGNEEAKRLFDEAGRSVQLGAPWAAITSLERAVKLDPNWIDAWLLLGDAQNMARQQTSAVTSYRKVISLDPKNVRGYEAVAKSLLALHHSEDAMQVWRDMLKVIPESSEATENLGTLLTEAGKYAEARPVLEKAVASNGEDAQLRFELGRTYIRLDLDDQASEQFQKAMELRTDPEMRSAIAQSLADVSRHLPDALRYAEEAVQETESKTANFRMEDPGSLRGGERVMSDLAAEWDTLGWVNFRAGDLVAAEKYATAAWKLALVPEFADHLAQVYDKEGKKALALRATGLALAALPQDGDPKLRDKLVSRVTASGTQGSWGKSQKELEGMRTFALTQTGDKSITAAFVVISDKGSDRGKAKFLSGAEELRGKELAIAAINFGTVFPDSVSVRILRAGTLSCNSFWKECRFTLMPYPPRDLFPHVKQ